MGESERSFEQMCREYAPRLERFCARLLGDAILAQDVAQETLLRAWERRGSLDPARDPSPWLFTVARNLCIEAMRARARTVAMANVPEGADDADPSDGLLADAERSLMRQALAAMTERQRQMLVMREVDEVAYPALASRLGVTEKTARVLMFRARRRLREHFLAIAGTLSVLWGSARFHAAQRARRVTAWMQTASPADGLVVNAAMGIVIASALVLPQSIGAGPSDAAPAIAATKPRAAVVHNVGDRAPARAAAVTVPAIAAPQVSGIDPRNGAQVRTPVAAPDGGKGHATIRIWREKDANDSIILGAVDRVCETLCAQQGGPR